MLKYLIYNLFFVIFLLSGCISLSSDETINCTKIKKGPKALRVIKPHSFGKTDKLLLDIENRDRSKAMVSLSYRRSGPEVDYDSGKEVPLSASESIIGGLKIQGNSYVFTATQQKDAQLIRLRNERGTIVGKGELPSSSYVQLIQDKYVLVIGDHTDAGLHGWWKVYHLRMVDSNLEFKAALSGRGQVFTDGKLGLFYLREDKTSSYLMYRDLSNNSRPVILRKFSTKIIDNITGISFGRRVVVAYHHGDGLEGTSSVIVEEYGVDAGLSNLLSRQRILLADAEPFEMGLPAVGDDLYFLSSVWAGSTGRLALLKKRQSKWIYLKIGRSLKKGSFLGSSFVIGSRLFFFLGEKQSSFHEFYFCSVSF